MMFHIDESFAPGSGLHDKEGFVPPVAPAQDAAASRSGGGCQLGRPVMRRS